MAATAEARSAGSKNRITFSLDRHRIVLPEKLQKETGYKARYRRVKWDTSTRKPNRVGTCGYMGEHWRIEEGPENVFRFVRPLNAKELAEFHPTVAKAKARAAKQATPKAPKKATVKAPKKTAQKAKSNGRKKAPKRKKATAKPSSKKGSD